MLHARESIEWETEISAPPIGVSSQPARSESILVAGFAEIVIVLADWASALASLSDHRLAAIALNAAGTPADFLTQVYQVRDVIPSERVVFHTLLL